VEKGESSNNPVVAKSTLSRPKKKVITPARVVAVLIILGLLAIKSFPQAPNLAVLATAKLTDINGKSVSFADLRGKVVLLDFMASWCPACKLETHYLINIYQQYGNNITMISISQWNLETDQTLAAFKNSFSGASWTFARDTAGLWTNLRLVDLPTLLVLDKQGNIRFEEGAAIGPITDVMLSTAISPLL
jgi:thiol-disulfide isomerase/thioredoxin